MKTTTSVIIVGLFYVLLVWIYGGWVRDDHHASIKAPQAAQDGRSAVYKVTAYCPCEKCCGAFADGITASGALAKGKLIAAPKSIPFGTWIEIEGYGWAEVLDRGGSIKGRRLDLLFPTHQEALNWGVKYLEINLGD
ncbi:MAG: 3D domain-containing protein [Thermodesulfovibrionales bacterium]|nr:3D domain-containing protein [Thermodesulfovibrionales bacterium]